MTEQFDKQCDVTIVGGGPAGCATGVFPARSDLKTCVSCIEERLVMLEVGRNNMVTAFGGSSER